MTLTSDQIANGETVIGVVKSLGLSPTDTQAAELDAIEGGLAESGLNNDNFGDYPSSMGGQMSSSRGIFQQIAAWGPLSVREDVAGATGMFLKGGQAGQTGLLSVQGWDTMPSWQAVQAVQQSEFADGSNYQAQYSPAVAFINAYGAGAPATSVPPASSSTTGGGGAQPAASVQPVGLVTDAENSIMTFALTALFIVLGLGLVGVGVWRVSEPERQKAEGALSKIPIPV